MILMIKASKATAAPFPYYRGSSPYHPFNINKPFNLMTISYIKSLANHLRDLGYASNIKPAYVKVSAKQVKNLKTK